MMQQGLYDLPPQRGDRRSDRPRNLSHALGQVDALQFHLHRRLDRGLLLRCQLCQRVAGRRQRDIVLRECREAHEIGGCVILTEIRAHSVQAAVIHEVGLLKPRLAGLYVARGHEDRTIARDEALGKGRRRFIGKLDGPGENGKGHNANAQQDPFQHVADRIF
jgi:hypothetical protein